MTDKRPNPLLSRLQIPGETFPLPSRGLFYHDGELADEVVNGEVHVYPMTAHDEIIFKTPDMLLSGKAIDEVFAKCIPQVLKPRQLLSKDVDFLITCLRIMTHGPDITLTFTHNCSEAKQHTYKSSLSDILRKSKPIDPTTLAEKFTVTMDNGQIVKLKPTTYETIMLLNQKLTTDEYSVELMRDKIMAILVDMIEFVDDISDKELIAEWVNAVPAGWVRFLSNAIDQVSDWGVDFKTSATCKDCGSQIEMPFSPNPVSFFS